MIRINLKQGSPEWRRWRFESGIGGSDAPIVMGVSPFSTRPRLLREKLRYVQREETFAMRRGTRLEPQARYRYERLVGCKATPTCIQHDDREWLIASLDGLCAPGPNCRYGRNAPAWVVEIKCPKWQDHLLALEGRVPEYYLPHVQHILLASGCDRCDYVSFNDGQRFDPEDQLAIVPVIFDPEYACQLLDAEEAFWWRVRSHRYRKSIRKAKPCRA
jgi:putative phage-type endonuclease